jgi:5-methylcytosine-specific restriction endonuclease McrA
MTTISETTRSQVRERERRRCEYCRKPEGISVYPHHIEHIIARKHGGTSLLDNLAWACFQCNVTKGSDIASYDSETNELTPLYNPRTDNWNDHFELLNDEVVGKTSIGRVTIRLLQINHPEQVEARRLVIAAGLW